MSERTYAPRSGGRTAARTGEPSRRYRTQGSAALQPESVGTEPARTRDTGAIDAAAPRLRVAPPVPISAPRAPFIAVVIGLVVAGVFGILVINTKTNENAFEISKLQDQQAGLNNQQQDLQNQIAGYESTGNLDAAARRLGLVKAGTPAYIRLPDGKIIGVPRPGEGQVSVTAQNQGSPSGAPSDADAQNGVTATGTGQPSVQTGAQNGAGQGTVQGGASGQPGLNPAGTGQSATNAAGTNPAGTTTAGGNTAGTNAAGGNTAGTNTAGSNTAGSNTAGTNTAGGTKAGANPAGTTAGGTTVPNAR